jgi:hypothetical protein
MGVLRELKRFSDAYVILLTTRTGEVDRKVGEDSGLRNTLVFSMVSGE